jgi:hypothetical protein
MRLLFVLGLLSAPTAGAQPIAALQPMAYLAGHCWRGEFPDGRQSDEHCFEWLYGGRMLRDTHHVHAIGRPDYVGETTYYWDAQARAVEFLYIENAGGFGHGTVQSQGNVLVFPASEFVSDGGVVTLRTRWTPIGDDAYEVLSETQTKTGWQTMIKMVLRRQSSAPGNREFMGVFGSNLRPRVPLVPGEGAHEPAFDERNSG